MTHLEATQVFSEGDLLAYLMENWRIGKFAKVYGISTLTISPDIDLLDVNESQKIVTGYEIKLLKYRKDWKRVNLGLMYKGIGQALSYFHFGVDKSYLILGISKDIPSRSVLLTMKKIKETIAIFNTLRSFINRRFEGLSERIGTLMGELDKYTPQTAVRYAPIGGPCGISCFGIKVWTGHNDLLMTKMKADENFPVSTDKDLQHKKNCLLRKEFKWDKTFLERWKAAKVR